MRAAPASKGYAASRRRRSRRRRRRRRDERRLHVTALRAGAAKRAVRRAAPARARSDGPPSSSSSCASSPIARSCGSTSSGTTPSQRVYEELLSDEHVTAWLICWMDDHDTGFHDHDVSAGAVAVVGGRVREERLAIGGEPRAAQRSPPARLPLLARRHPSRAPRRQRPGGHAARLLAAAGAHGRVRRSTTTACSRVTRCPPRRSCARPQEPARRARDPRASGVQAAFALRARAALARPPRRRSGSS